MSGHFCCARRLPNPLRSLSGSPGANRGPLGSGGFSEVLLHRGLLLPRERKSVDQWRLGFVRTTCAKPINPSTRWYPHAITSLPAMHKQGTDRGLVVDGT
jgi:hypothetical protein